jgi:serine/threonine protein kinase
MDFFNGGDLHWHLNHGPPFQEKRAAFYASELTLALEHLHSLDIVYRDVKPENCMISADGHIALVDFGLSKTGVRAVNGAHTIVGTPSYAAPEILIAAGHRNGYGSSIDW